VESSDSSKLPRKSLRFLDLKCVGINNWPTLKRRVEQDNFPPGRYVGKNTRVWTEEEVSAWWEARPTAGPPENGKGASAVCTSANPRDLEAPVVTPETSDSMTAVNPLQKRSG
jgi:predicted DNA-binding transcriptional regulator AlpA